MNQNICNNCGADYEYRNGRWKCRACGAYKPEENSSEEISLLYTAYQQLRLAKFDESEQEFDDIIEKYPENPTAYWGRLMAKYGIKYERDFDGRMIPTCYATSIESLLSSFDYKKAMEYADEDTKEYYRSQAEYIERVRKEWIEKASKEKPYDIFISYKESDLENGIERTQDSVEMQELYIHLTNKGYRVFYSRESLRNKIGERYEPYIFNALSTAKIMLVYGSKPEYITSTWLKNEWTRYEKRIRIGEKNPDSLLVACDGFSPAELPSILSAKQCLNANTKGFFSDLDEVIENILRDKKKRIHGSVQSAPTYSEKNIKKKHTSNTQNQKSGIFAIIAFCLILAITISFFSWYGSNGTMSDTSTTQNEESSSTISNSSTTQNEESSSTISDPSSSTTSKNEETSPLPWNNGYNYDTRYSNANLPLGNLILVNKDTAYSLADTLNDRGSTDLYGNKDLGYASLYVLPGSGVKVHNSILPHLKQMLADMVADDTNTLGTAIGEDKLYIDSAYRDFATQEEKNAANSTRYPELPGYSEHHTGLAFDLRVLSNGAYIPMRDVEYQWLEEHSAEYGFVFRYESNKAAITGMGEANHLRYVGIPHATYMNEKELCLEEYLKLLREDYNYANCDAPLEITAGEKEYIVYYVEATTATFTTIPLPPASEGTPVISGDNMNGFIVTVEKTSK